MQFEVKIFPVRQLSSGIGMRVLNLLSMVLNMHGKQMRSWINNKNLFFM